MTDPFIVHVAVLRRVLGTVTDVALVGPFDPDDELAPTAPTASRIEADADMEITATLTSSKGSIMATGVATAQWSGLCSRCALPVRGTLAAPFDELFMEKIGAEEEAYPIENDMIDLGPAGREWLIVGLPLLPLCRQDCAGLCPSCGVDRNTESCSCAAPVDTRWAALDALKGEDPQEG